MIYKILSPVETNAWIRLLEGTIAKAEELQKYWDDVEADIRQKYKEQYSSKWIWRFLHGGADPRDVFVTFGGRIMHADSYFFTLCSLRELTYVDLQVRDFTWDWTGGCSDSRVEMYKSLTHSRKLKDILNAVHRSWCEFADRPFQIEEKDVGHYLDIEAIDERLDKLLNRLKEQNK